jgi:hypothetical protein
LAIAVFYAIGTGIGLVGPWLLGAIIETGSRSAVALGYLLGSSLMIVAALIGWVWGIATERKPLEAVCAPVGQLE